MLLLRQRWHFASFHSLASLLSKAEEIPSRTLKIQTILAYLQKHSTAERQQINTIFHFVSDREKTNISQARIYQHYLSLSHQPSNVYQSRITEIAIQLGKHIDKSDLQISDIINLLGELKRITGTKSLETKMGLLFQALRKMSVVENQFLMRIIDHDLRIGVKAKGFELAQELVENVSAIETGTGDAKPEKIQHTANSNSFQPMLAKPLRELRDLRLLCEAKAGDILLDVKYDGERTIIIYHRSLGLQMKSRNGKSQLQVYSQLAKAISQELSSFPEINSITIDGEIVCVNSQSEEPLPMQILRNRRKIVDNQELIKEVEAISDANLKDMVYAFDVLEYNGVNLIQHPLIERRTKIPHKSILKESESKIIKYPEEEAKIFEYLQAVMERKYEGLILKGTQDLYFSNGSRVHWGKLKRGFNRGKTDNLDRIELDLVVMGGYHSKQRSINLNSFLVGVRHEGKIYPISKVGSGFSVESYEQIGSLLSDLTVQSPDNDYVIPPLLKCDVWFRPKLIVEVVCQQFTRSPFYSFGFKEDYGGLSLRFPIFKRVRLDKDVQNCTTGEELLELSRSI